MRSPRAAWIVGTVAVVALPLVVDSRAWLNLCVLTWIYATMALGLTMLFGYARQVSFGHGGFFAIGAYVSALLSVKSGVNVWLAMALGTIASGAVGYVIGRPVLRLRGLSLAMATLAFGQIVFVLATQLSITGGPIGLAGIPAPELGPIDFAEIRNYYWLTAAVLLISLLISRNICRSAVGRSLIALGWSDVAARVSSVDPSYKTRAFMYSASLAGLAGALYAHYFTFVSSDTFGLDLSLIPVIMIVVGGLHSLWGAVLGAIVITFMRDYLHEYQEFSQLVYGLMLIAVFMAAPRGLVGLGESACRLARRIAPRAPEQRPATQPGSEAP